MQNGIMLQTMGKSKHIKRQPTKAFTSEKRYRAKDIPIILKPGLYALYLNNQNELNSIRIGPSGLLYIGMTESSLDSRNHFEHDDSGFSSLRRSLGALLKRKLRLQAIPRAQGPSKTNLTNYRFTDAGERKLTKWMNLVVRRDWYFEI